MSDNKNPILSICIPTYNRANTLHSNLLSIFNQIDENTDVEIIISNNKSTDSTYEVVQKFLHHTKLKYYEQTENLGATKNFLKLIHEYATGEFCWIIGDDDFLLQGTIKAVVDLIRSKKNVADYFYATVKGIDMKKFNSYNQRFDTTLYKEFPKIVELDYQSIDKFEELISPQYSIIFLGELMASIFRRTYWLQNEISGEGENLETLETTYPHSVILARAFFGKKAIFIKTPLILALEGEREWWDKLGYILIVQVKNLLELYRDLGLPKKILKKCYKTYIEISFKYFGEFLVNRDSKYRSKVSIKRYIFFLVTHPSLSTLYLIKQTVKALLKTFQKNATK